jgi:AraC-like DNA-binding protein
MLFGRLLSEMEKRSSPHPSQDYQTYNEAGKFRFYTYYPDKSLYFEDLISVIAALTREGRHDALLLGTYMLKRDCNVLNVRFPEGVYIPCHKNNFIELTCIACGDYHKQIEDVDYVFRKGELILINRDVMNTEKLFYKDMAYLSLRIANAFFDKPAAVEAADEDSERFTRRITAGRKKSFHFIHFIPKIQARRIPGLMETILDEVLKGEPGSSRIISGYVERILNLLPLEYEAVFYRENKARTAGDSWEEIRRYVEEHYRDILIQDLTGHFGHGVNYFNGLFKKYTGKTYTRYLQNIRLEKAEILLKTTNFPVEEVSRLVGYENTRYFYEIFYRKFRMKPRELRKLPG